ncbi:hypothetical protein [Prosthecobacter sp.]|jgi:hypothetical protein|uniref:hypothetical protein n=1 Tax=Prosthecobacter sp. TaxID=1965333 RepID=UPI003784D4F5
MPAHPRQPLPRPLAQRLVVMLVCLSLGMHWVLLQGVAWTGMIISFASQGTVLEAVEKTFDGQHGCALCAKVKEGRESSQKEPGQSSQSLKKIDAVLVEITKLVTPAAKTISFVFLREEGEKRTLRPEMPPPRRGLV